MSEHPVIRDLRDAIGEHIDRRQVEIVRAYLDTPTCSVCLDGRGSDAWLCVSCFACGRVAFL